MHSEIVQSTLRITKALSDWQRIRILMMLEPGELCVCQIVEVLALAPSTVSKHLSLLSAAGLVDVRKEGRWAYYKLPDGPAGALPRPWLAWLHDRLRTEPAIRRDRQTLRAILTCKPERLCRRQRDRRKEC